MECLTPTVNFDLFTDNYFTSFRLFVGLPTLELKTLNQEVCSKNRLRKYTIIGDKQLQKKRNVATLNSAAHI